jgi:hypothetical protein
MPTSLFSTFSCGSEQTTCVALTRGPQNEGGIATGPIVVSGVLSCVKPSAYVA